MEQHHEVEKDHLQLVLDFYPLEVSDVWLVSSRSGRTTWEVDTTEGKKILKQANMKPERMLFLAGAHQHLYNQGLAITPIHETKNGGICIGAGPVSYVLFDKVEGNEVIYYNKEQMLKAMKFAGSFYQASKGYVPSEESKTRGRLGKWHKLYRWKLQELEGNKTIAQSYPEDAFSQLFLAHVDEMITRAQLALIALENPSYTNISREVSNLKGFCQQDFTLARFTEMEEELFMKELHSVTYDLPTRDIRIILNKMMKKFSVWDDNLVFDLLRAYQTTNPLSEEYYEILSIDIQFPHLFCAIAHKYFLAQKRSWSDEKYIWALQNIIALEESKGEFLKQYPSIYKEVISTNREGN
ncbi:CotS family spore coat protein [Sutcliffiella rhizosphaerae]|uniref:Spore coat protein S n=1 Tax=Sutcliffiella rhizosphaerae TaxID=2880967 RepID=A0ABM8YK28_9BACI|nr:CotS family spore coat protein [Sutcliffiella rhizosphaerae]CAG9620285.1 Spore coat protein S [Sutcliffiella rhizosphaerae]